MNSCRWIAGAVLVATIGCGGGGTGGSSAGPTANDAAQDVARMLKDFAEAKKRPPSGLAEMGDFDATHPLGYGAVRSGDYVVFWKAPISAGASGTVLAHQKDVPTKGGPVVMQDGSVKQLTADEFKSAPKAGK